MSDQSLDSSDDPGGVRSTDGLFAYSPVGAEVLALLERFGPYLERDGRHNLWLAAPPAGQLILDRHEVIYAYGPVADIAGRLLENGFKEESAIRVPVPHSHHFHTELDTDEKAILDHWEWLHGELQETDDL